MGKRGFSGKKSEQKIYLGQICGRLAAGRSLLQRHSLYRLPGGRFSRMKVCKRFFGSRWWSPSAGRSHRRVTACTPTRRGKVCGRLTASRRLCRVQSRYGSPPRRSFCSYKRNQNTLGAVPQDPLTLKLRLDTNDVNIVRTAPQIRSQGACGAFYFGFCRDRIKNQPYKRRLAPDSGGRRPSGRGVPTRYGSLGRSPE